MNDDGENSSPGKNLLLFGVITDLFGLATYKEGSGLSEEELESLRYLTGARDDVDTATMKHLIDEGFAENMSADSYQELTTDLATQKAEAERLEGRRSTAQAEYDDAAAELSGVEHDMSRWRHHIPLVKELFADQYTALESSHTTLESLSNAKQAAVEELDSAYHIVDSKIESLSFQHKGWLPLGEDHVRLTQKGADELPEGFMATLDGKLGYCSSSRFTFKYNEKGKLAKLKGKLAYCSDNKFTFHYDDEDRLVELRGKLGYCSGNRFKFKYDDQDRLVELKGKLGYCSGSSFKFTYDGDERMPNELKGKIGYCSGSSFKFEQDADGRVAGLKGKLGYCSGNGFELTHDDKDRVVEVQGKLGYCSGSKFTFDYDEQDGTVEMQGKLGYCSASSFKFAFDDLGRIEHIDGKLGYCSGRSFDFSYGHRDVMDMVPDQ